jgi:hypothetical protein
MPDYKSSREKLPQQPHTINHQAQEKILPPKGWIIPNSARQLLLPPQRPLTLHHQAYQVLPLFAGMSEESKPIQWSSKEKHTGVDEPENQVLTFVPRVRAKVESAIHK